jgi:catalase
VYELLLKKVFDMSEVTELAKTAHEWYKEAKFRPSQGEKLVGYSPRASVYNM